MTFSVRFILFASMLGVVGPALGQPLAAGLTREGFEVQNSLARKVLAFDTTGRAGPVQPSSLYMKALGREALAPAAAPWFSFRINGAEVTSLDPVWVYEGGAAQQMKHGGVEHTLRFRADAGPAAGLKISYTIQAYPASPVFRERIRLGGAAEAGLRLGLTDGQIHAVFPGYTFRREGAHALRETRIATWAADLLDPAPALSPDDRTGIEGLREGANLSQNYMFHPRRIDLTPAAGVATLHKGPFLTGLLPERGYGWFMAYEHGSPDGVAAQNWAAITHAEKPEGSAAAVRPLKGAYFDGEVISDRRPYTSLWSEVGVFGGSTFDDAEAILWEYLYRWINDEPASRKPVVYYNTWGMQRDEQRRNRDVHGVLTIDRALKEVEAAEEIGVDMFVLDDGWQNAFGDWQPNPQKFPKGLAPLQDELKRRGMVLGIWMAPVHVDSFATVVKQRPEWLIRNAAGTPVVTRWSKNMVCLVSDYYDQFLASVKRLIDAGALHFKWDGVDTDTFCSSPDHRHGDRSQTPEERADRYGYEFARYAVRAIEELKAYNPDVVVEFDATEPNRNIGLAVLSEARYFWMNNGASWYGDRSPFRVQSMRMAPALYHRLIPPVLQMAANYPHNEDPYRTQRYAVNTSLLGGLGFWGDLSQMPSTDRRRVGELVGTAKRVMDRVAATRPSLEGFVGSTPEIYTYIDRETATGQVIGFSGAPTRTEHRVKGVRPAALLAVLRNAYTTDSTGVTLPFQFAMPGSSREAFLIGNGETGIGITQSTSWLKDARLGSRGELVFVNGYPGRHVVRMPARAEPPVVRGSLEIRSRVLPAPAGYTEIEVETLYPDTQVTVE